jgi:hypothetical protein
MDLPEEEAPDQVLLTGQGLLPFSQEVSEVVGPLREANRLLAEAESTARLEHLRMLFKELLGSRAYYWYVMAPVKHLGRIIGLQEAMPCIPGPPGQRVVGRLLPQNPALLDDLRLSALGLLDAGKPSGADTEALSEQDHSILTVLRLAYPKAMTQQAVADKLAELAMARDRTIINVGERSVRDRWSILLERRLIVPPPRTKRKGAAISEKGLRLMDRGRT